MSSSNEGAPSQPQQNGDKVNETSTAEDKLKKLQLSDLVKDMASSDQESTRDMSKHKFWQTQPVAKYDDATTTPSTTTGPIDPNTDITRVQQEPYTLIPGFEWVTLDITNPTETNDIYTLLYANYVEDTSEMFRFNYSAPFLSWALQSPGWRKDWHIGIRASTSKKLVAFISAVPCSLRIRGESLRTAEVNFMCVHKKLRAKRLAPVLIREITRRVNLQGMWQAVYTGGTLLPTPVATCRYFHRALDWQKLYEVRFSGLPPGSTPQRQRLRYKLPEKTGVKGLRGMEERDVSAVTGLLGRYLERTEMAQGFTEEEVRHWMLNPEAEGKAISDAGKKGAERVVHAYVVEDEEGKVTDFFSFYGIDSTVIGHEKHDKIAVAYLFYYATEAAFSRDGTGKEKATSDGSAKESLGLKKRLNELMNDALILAKKFNYDVFNALTLLDNPLFLADQKFGPGDGRLHYYLYNYRTTPIAGGMNNKAEADVNKMGGVGMIML